MPSQALIRHSQIIARKAEEEKKKKAKEEEKRKAAKAPDSEEDLFEEEEKEEEEDDYKAEQFLKETLVFRDVSDEEGKLMNIIESLRSEWKVVQIDTDLHHYSRFRKEKGTEAITKDNFSLFLTVVGCGDNAEIGVHQVDKVDKGGRPTIMQELLAIINAHRDVYKVGKAKDFVKAKYDEVRGELDDRMHGLLRTMQDKWLGHARTLLLGRPIDQGRVAKITQAMKAVADMLRLSKADCARHRQLLFGLIDGASLLTPDDMTSAYHAVTAKKSKLKEWMKALTEFGENNPCGGGGGAAGIERHPVCFIFDKEIQALPWEAIPMLAGHPCSRVPSIHYLYALYKTHEKNGNSVAKVGVRNDKVFYIMNPNKDLDKTQKRLEKPFKKLSLGEGVVGEWPTFPKMQTALSEMDAFVYIGHGGNMKTISGQEIEKLRVRAVPLLFGCNSGKMERLGRMLDPTGTVASYLIATSPCLLGFHWSVTDLDLDTWTASFLKHWLGDKKGDPEIDIVRAVSQKRGSFTRILNGAAAVVYGLPEFLK